MFRHETPRGSAPPFRRIFRYQLQNRRWCFHRRRTKGFLSPGEPPFRPQSIGLVAHPNLFVPAWATFGHELSLCHVFDSLLNEFRGWFTLNARERTGTHTVNQFIGQAKRFAVFALAVGDLVVIHLGMKKALAQQVDAVMRGLRGTRPFRLPIVYIGLFIS